MVHRQSPMSPSLIPKRVRNCPREAWLPQSKGQRARWVSVCSPGWVEVKWRYPLSNCNHALGLQTNPCKYLNRLFFPETSRECPGWHEQGLTKRGLQMVLLAPGAQWLVTESRVRRGSQFLGNIGSFGIKSGWCCLCPRGHGYLERWLLASLPHVFLLPEHVPNHVFPGSTRPFQNHPWCLSAQAAVTNITDRVA